MKSGKRLLTMLLLVFLLLATFSACTTAPSKIESPLLEFPGTTWNSTPEAVREALNLSEKQIRKDEMQVSDRWLLEAENVPCFGTTAETVQFYFYQYEDNGEYALAHISVAFPDDADMNAVKKEMAKQYGTGAKEAPMIYFLEEGKLMAHSSANASSTADLPTEEGYVPNYWYWTAGISGTEYFSEAALDRAVEWLGSGAYPTERETALEYLEKRSLAIATWTDNELLGVMIGGEYPSNVVDLDAIPLVYLLRNFGE